MMEQKDQDQSRVSLSGGPWSQHGSSILDSQKRIIATAWPVADPEGTERATMIVEALNAALRGLSPDPSWVVSMLEQLAHDLLPDAERDAKAGQLDKYRIGQLTQRRLNVLHAVEVLRGLSPPQITEQNDEDLSRSDQPQPSSGAADPRGEDRGSSIDPKALERVNRILSTIDVVVFKESTPDGSWSAWVAQARQIENAQQGPTPETALSALRRCLIVDAVVGAAIGAVPLACPDDVWLRLTSEPTAILYKLRFDVQEPLLPPTGSGNQATSAERAPERAGARAPKSNSQSVSLSPPTHVREQDHGGTSE